MEVMIPPWVRPESPETIRTIDDATSAFPPAFGRGLTQRGIWADPRWGLRRRYRGLRSDEKAAILNALNETRGQLNILRVTPHTPIRGSFATSELITNNTFASGTTGWTAYSAGSDSNLSVSDRILRSTIKIGSGAPFVYRQVTGLTQYAPYAMRGFIDLARGAGAGWYGFTAIGSSPGTTDYAGSSVVPYSRGAMRVAVAVVPVTNPYIGAGGSSVLGNAVGDYVNISYTSFARCALIDIGTNLLLQSDALGTTWGATAASISSNTDTSPDGNVTADSLVDTGVSTPHFVVQAVNVSSAIADYSFSVAVKKKVRNYVVLQLQEATGVTAINQTFDVNAGAVGVTTTVGANWSNLRSVIVDMGNGWYSCTITGRKTNAATQISAYIVASNADTAGGSTYSGGTSATLALWRATLAQSSVPARLVQTTTMASAGTSPTGSDIYTKGWPVSTSELLLTGDWFEINGELKQLTAPVNSDAAGLAYIQFRPGLAGSPADNDPIIVYEPFGRFVYPGGTREIENLFGIYGDCEMNLEEIYS